MRSSDSCRCAVGARQMKCDYACFREWGCGGRAHSRSDGGRCQRTETDHDGAGSPSGDARRRERKRTLQKESEARSHDSQRKGRQRHQGMKWEKSRKIMHVHVLQTLLQLWMITHKCTQRIAFNKLHKMTVLTKLLQSEVDSQLLFYQLGLLSLIRIHTSSQTRCQKLIDSAVLTNVGVILSLL